MIEVPLRTSVTTISRNEIRRFAVSINAMDPIHHDVAAARRAGYRDLVGPPSLFSILGLSLDRILPSSALREDGLPLDDEAKGRLVAGESTIEWYGEIVAGDEVTLTEQLVDTFSKTGRSGILNGFKYLRLYKVKDVVVVRELLTRIAR
jgi:acyl dehydratase